MSSEFPTTVSLQESDAKALRKLNDAQVSVSQFIEMVTKQGEIRLGQVQEEGRTTWQNIAKKYNLDLDRCAYTLANDGKTLVLTGVRYGTR